MMILIPPKSSPPSVEFGRKTHSEIIPMLLKTLHQSDKYAGYMLDYLRISKPKREFLNTTRGKTMVVSWDMKLGDISTSIGFIQYQSTSEVYMALIIFVLVAIFFLTLCLISVLGFIALTMLFLVTIGMVVVLSRLSRNIRDKLGVIFLLVEGPEVLVRHIASHFAEKTTIETYSELKRVGEIMATDLPSFSQPINQYLELLREVHRGVEG